MMSWWCRLFHQAHWYVAKVHMTLLEAPVFGDTHVLIRCAFCPGKKMHLYKTPEAIREIAAEIEKFK